MAWKPVVTLLSKSSDKLDALVDSIDAIVSIPIEIIVSVGKVKPLIQDLIKMKEGTVLTLDKRLEDPVDLVIGNKLIARGRLEELEGNPAGRLSVRLTEITKTQAVSE